jgi:hypothetical protein
MLSSGRSFVVVNVLACLLSAPGTLAAGAEAAEEPPRALIIGDSISIGYTEAVAEALAAKVEVLRIPVNGGSTWTDLEQLDAWLGDQRWAVIHFNWGLHDCNHMKDGRLDNAAGSSYWTEFRYWAWSLAPAPPARSPADFDGDGDVDLVDYGFFLACFNGPNRPFAGLPGCYASDLDQDADVDMVDFMEFQACFNGPNRPPQCP